MIITSSNTTNTQIIPKYNIKIQIYENMSPGYNVVKIKPKFKLGSQGSYTSPPYNDLNQNKIITPQYSNGYNLQQFFDKLSPIYDEKQEILLIDQITCSDTAQFVQNEFSSLGEFLNEYFRDLYVENSKRTIQIMSITKDSENQITIYYTSIRGTYISYHYIEIEFLDQYSVSSVSYLYQ